MILMLAGTGRESRQAERAGVDPANLPDPRRRGDEMKHHGAADPWRLLGAAILGRAGLDLWSSDPMKRAEARAWLIGDPWARYLADELDVRGDVLRAVTRSTKGNKR